MKIFKPKRIEKRNSKIYRLPIGINLQGDNYYLPLFTESGGSTTLIGGNPGYGKSSLLKIILLF
mgnify:CR=1 FL=1